MPIRKITILSLALIVTVKLFAQDSLTIGSWGSFLPYTTGTYLSQTDDKIIYSTQWSLFTIDKADYSISLYDKINLLTDIGISRHKYDEFTDQLVVVYEDSNIDIIQGDRVVNIPDIRNNTTIVGDKSIYNIYPVGDGKILLSCGFGVVELDLTTYEFGFSCFTDVKVYQSSVFSGKLVMATEDGLYLYDPEEHSNPADFQLWEHLGSDHDLPEIYTAPDLVAWNDHLYFTTGEELFKAGGELLFSMIYSSDEDNRIAFLNRSENALMLGLAFQYEESRVLFFDASDQFIQSDSKCSNLITFAELDEQGRLWYADQKGAIRYALDRVYPCETIEINSPYSNNVSDIATQGERLFIASGGVDASYTYLFRRDGFFIWDGEKWRNYNEGTVDLFGQVDIYDCFRILPHPSGDRVYVGSYFSGLLELDLETDEIKLYDDSNSTLRGKTGDPLRDRVSGLAFDTRQNLWISNFGAPRPVSVLTQEGEWIALDVQSGKDLRDVVIDGNGYKWFIVDREAEGLLVFDEGGNLADQSDDRQRIISKNNSVLQSNKVNAIEVDLNGDVWVGTADGFVVFDCGAGVFDNDCQGSRRTTSLEGFGAYVLDDVNITCIETDGANRKWFGSESGIFVQSPSGEEQIYHFTKENSPLFDNTIIDMAFNEKNGTMFIATARGVMSFRTNSTLGGEKHSSEIYAYPNPVRPEYRGPIAIRGFARDSNIKITDINGQLVHESTSFGGQAIWDGYDYNGRRAATGVYLVYASTTDAFEEPQTVITRILLIN
jgi:sugar lactone lactonase YvrE